MRYQPFLRSLPRSPWPDLYVGPRPVASHHAMVEFEGGIRRYQAAWSSRACLVECSWGPSPMSCDARLRVTTEDAQRARTTIRFTQPSR